MAKPTINKLISIAIKDGYKPKLDYKNPLMENVILADAELLETLLRHNPIDEVIKNFEWNSARYALMSLSEDGIRRFEDFNFILKQIDDQIFKGKK